MTYIALAAVAAILASFLLKGIAAILRTLGIVALVLISLAFAKHYIDIKHMHSLEAWIKHINVHDLKQHLKSGIDQAKQNLNQYNVFKPTKNL